MKTTDSINTTEENSKRLQEKDSYHPLLSRHTVRWHTTQDHHIYLPYAGFAIIVILCVITVLRVNFRQLCTIFTYLLSDLQASMLSGHKFQRRVSSSLKREAWTHIKLHIHHSILSCCVTHQRKTHETILQIFSPRAFTIKHPIPTLWYIKSRNYQKSQKSHLMLQIRKIIYWISTIISCWSVVRNSNKLSLSTPAKVRPFCFDKWNNLSLSFSKGTFY